MMDTEQQLNMTDQFIDRVSYTENLVNDIKIFNNKKENRVRFLWANSGHGKTRLIQNLDKEVDKSIIILNTMPINNDIVKKGEYIRLIAKELDLYFKNSNFSLTYCLEHGDIKYQYYLERDEIIANADSVGRAVFMQFGRPINGYKYIAKEILEGDGDECFLLQKEYFEYILGAKGKDIIIDITNFQNIDPCSMSALLEALLLYKGLYFIFEYTTIDDNIQDLLRNIDCFKRIKDTCVDSMKLEKLSYDHAILVYSGKNNILEVPIEVQKEFNIFYDTIAKGNIYSVKEASLTNKLDKNPINELYKNLKFDEKILLCIICIYSGEISAKKLLAIKKKCEKRLYFQDDALQNLSHIMSIENDFYIAKHASLVDSVFESDEIKTAFTLLNDYIIQQMQDIRNIDIHDLMCLINYYTRFADTRIINVLEKFKYYIVNSLSRNQITDIISTLIADTNSNEYLILRLALLTYDIGMYEFSDSLLSRITHENKTYFLLKAILLNRLDRIDESQNTVIVANERYCDDVRFELVCLLIKMLNYKTLGKTVEYFDLFNSIYENNKYKECDEYSIFLRNTIAFLPIRKSIPYIKESLTRTNENSANYARALLSLLIQEARLGNIRNAQKKLSEIKKVIVESTFERHIIYTNEAALLLLDDPHNPNIELLLDKAKMTVTNSFDYLSILNNRLCFYILNSIISQDIPNIITTIQDMLSTEPDKRMHLRSYTNMYLYYKQIGNEELKDKYFRQCNEYSDIQDNLVDALLKQNCIDENYLFMFSKGIYVSFISYWHFEIPILE